MHKIQRTFKIISNARIKGTFYRMCLDAKDAYKNAKPGQFVNIRVNGGLEPFFRRPFGVAQAGKSLEIIYDVVGKGTLDLSKKNKGDILDVLGPLGNSFSSPEKNIEQIILIAGGIGFAPLMMLATSLKNFKGRKVLLFGGRTKDQVCCTDVFKKLGFTVHISTDDGSLGTKGRVSRLFSKIDTKLRTFIYACGPNPMMKSVQEFVRRNNLQGEASCEEVMACGIGTCLGCAVCTCDGYKTSCKDGPVFDINKVIF